MACSKNPPDDRLKGWEVHAENMIRYGLKNGRVNLRDFNTAIEYLKEDDFPLAKIGELSCFLFELWKKLDNPPPPTPPSSQVGPPDDQGVCLGIRVYREALEGFLLTSFVAQERDIAAASV